MTKPFRRTLLLASAALAFLALSPGDALSQRGASAPPEHADVEPINNLPNPYETVRDWGMLPDGRNWGSVSAVHVDIEAGADPDDDLAWFATQEIGQLVQGADGA